jgi:hypothetical protein
VLTTIKTPEVLYPNMQRSLEFLQKWAVANNIILETIQKDSEEDFKRRQKNMTHARTNETSKLANDYRMLAMDFRSKNKQTIEQFKQHILAQSEQLSDKNLSTISDIEFAARIIGWYEVQLPVRITQAYVGLSEYVETTTDPIQNDFNGSAKVVLIGIENSFVAWEVLLRHFPELGKQCVQPLILLDRIRKRILADFPNAGLFMRPGFDESGKVESSSFTRL